MKNSLFLLLLLIAAPINGLVFSQEANTVDPFLVESTSTLRFFRDMGNASSVIAYIPEGTEIEIFEEFEQYYSARYEGEKGYILIEKTKPLNFALRPVQDTKSEVQQEDRMAYLLGKYDGRTARALYRKGVWRGMSMPMAMDSWGKPGQIERYMESEPRIEEWIYKTHILHFKGGKLERWEER